MAHAEGVIVEVSTVQMMRIRVSCCLEVQVFVLCLGEKRLSG